MRFVRFLTVAVLALAMANPALAAGKAKKKAGKPVKGTVVEVKKDEGKETGSLIVKVAPGKKNAGGTATDKTYKVSDTTKFKKSVGKKKDATTSEAKFSDVTKDAKVTLLAKGDKGDEASEITFQIAKKKKKAKKQ